MCGILISGFGLIVLGTTLLVYASLDRGVGVAHPENAIIIHIKLSLNNT